MDDTAQQSGVSQVPQDQQMQVPQQQGVQPNQPSEPVQNVSQASVPVGGKEHASGTVAEAQPAQPEVIVSQEVQEAGVEATSSEEVQLTEEHKQAGIEPAKEATPLPQGPTNIQLPDEYKPPKGLGLLHQNVKKAATWLWLLLFKAQKQSERLAQTQQKT